MNQFVELWLRVVGFGILLCIYNRARDVIEV